ncbi:hypothetical protein Ct61P_14885 [Colletotrichum tofieldiae]|nr:hypothetical protein Ct61P_14885 [Colletotrichum tofieldiae]
MVYEFAFIRLSGIHLAGKKASLTLNPSKFLWKRKDVRHSRRRTRRGNANDRIPVSFLGSCKQVHGEARAMLYANHFRLEDMETLAVWLRDLGSGNIVYLRRIQIRTEPQSWSPRVSAKVESQQRRYRDVCRKVAKMLAVSRNLESLQTAFYYHHKIEPPRSSLRRPGPVSGWMSLARKIAELLYDDFRPIFSHGLSRGRTPEQLCSVLDVSQNNWWGRRHSLTPSQLNAKDAELAEKEVVEHSRLLLERNLRYRLHPRYRAQDSNF